MILLAVIVRVYWSVALATFAAIGSPHTHVKIDGYVAYAKPELDGDLHIRLVGISGAPSPFVTAECIPSLPCVKPKTMDHVLVSGISRKDGEHGWTEIHPVEKIEVLP